MGRSRGKGSRRKPWRDGGAKRSKPGLPDVPAVQIPRTPTLRSHWVDLLPIGLSNAHRNHPWMFAAYDEFGRSDGRHYTAFLFRNKDRTVFGIREWFDWSAPNRAALRQMARRVVTDDAFRVAMISDDPDLPQMWRRH